MANFWKIIRRRTKLKFTGQRVELSARRRPLEGKLRLQFRRPRGLEPAMARSRCATRWTGCATDWRRFTNPRRGRFLKDPWAARDDYISVILDRSPENIAKFFGRHAPRALSEDEQVTALRLLEMQRHAMLMFTSCGWFFDEISGIETVQVIQYAARAIQLAKDLWPEDLEPGFLEILDQGEKQPARKSKWAA